MKIAVVTDDSKTISRHFGRAESYLVFTVDGTITDKELRPKNHQCGHGHEHGHGHHHHDHEEGHEHGEGAEDKHQGMTEAIKDCNVLITRGMGNGAYFAMQQAGIEAIITSIEDAEEAVKAYTDGLIVNHLNKLH